MRINLLHKIFALALLISLSVTGWAQKEASFAIGAESFELNGKPYVIRCGEMHFAPYTKGRVETTFANGQSNGVKHGLCLPILEYVRKTARSVYQGQKLFKNL